MLIKTETVQTIWIGMTREQQGDLIKVLIELSNNSYGEAIFSENELEACSCLRQALMNV